MANQVAVFLLHSAYGQRMNQNRIDQQKTSEELNERMSPLLGKAVEMLVAFVVVTLEEAISLVNSD